MQFYKDDKFVLKNLIKDPLRHPHFFSKIKFQKNTIPRGLKKEKNKIITKEIQFGEINMMNLENSMFYFKSCFYSEPFFHDVYDNHMRYQYLTKHLSDAQNKKQQYEFFKKSPMYHVMTLSTFYF